MGTHKDKVPKSEDHEKISQELLGLFSLHPAWKSLVRFSAAESTKGRAVFCFFPVDNTLGRNDETVRHLMSSMEQTILRQDYVQKEHPLCWYYFLDEMEAKKKNEDRDCLSLQEVLGLARQCGLSGE